jgi:hypothetical protein
MKLHGLSQCPEFAHDLLNIIQDGLLIPNSKKRWECSVIGDKLDQIRKKCEVDSSYCLQAESRSTAQRVSAPHIFSGRLTVSAGSKYSLSSNRWYQESVQPENLSAPLVLGGSQELGSQSEEALPPLPPASLSPSPQSPVLKPSDDGPSMIRTRGAVGLNEGQIFETDSQQLLLGSSSRSASALPSEVYTPTPNVTPTNTHLESPSRSRKARKYWNRLKDFCCFACLRSEGVG